MKESSSSSDSTGISVSKSSHSEQKGSTDNQEVDSSGTTKESGEYDRETITYEYDSIIRIPNSDKNTFDSSKQHSDTTLRIPVKKTFTKEKGHTEKMQTFNLQKKDSTSVIANNQEQHSDSTAGEVKKKAAELSSHKFRFNFNWLWFLLIPAAWVIWRYWPRIYPIIKSFIP